MQRILIVLVVGLLAVGCLTPEQKQKALRDSLAGEYEHKDKEGGHIAKYVFLENGIAKVSNKEREIGEYKWSISNGELHVDESGLIVVFRINKDKSITHIVTIVDGKRPDLQGDGWTYKKIK